MESQASAANYAKQAPVSKRSPTILRRERAGISARLDVIKHMEGFVEEELNRWLKPVSDLWQPSDLLPNLTAENWVEGIEQLREQARALSDEILVVLVGHLVTEEALPTYQTWLNRAEGINDPTGTSDNPWAQWSRGWTAEENRHGDVLLLYLYLSGRVDMRAVSITTQHLIRNGFDPRSGTDPYPGLIYPAFQERATKISHGNVGRLAHNKGDQTLGKICNIIAGDEARHEEAYKRFVGKIFEQDPAGAILAFARVMKKRVTMPARLMSDGKAENLFGQFANVAQRIGVYTARDYAAVIEHLVEYWGVARLSGLPRKALEAQDYLCGLAEHYRGYADELADWFTHQPKVPFSWIFDRPV